MKNLIYGMVLVVVLFGVAGYLFRQWMDTRIYTSRTCMHLAITTATLENKTPLGACYWRIGDNKQVDEHWFNCGEYEVGETIDWEYTNYSCNDLLRTLN